MQQPLKSHQVSFTPPATHSSPLEGPDPPRKVSLLPPLPVTVSVYKPADRFLGEDNPVKHPTAEKAE